jgi:DNA-directed RNA polymerase specialized sigma24 family protein
VTGPWEELRTTGAVGALSAAALYETVDAVRRFDRYPPPEGYEAWDEAAVHEIAHDFLSGDGSNGRLARIVASATDEASFERVLEAAVRNHFRMAARKTDTGAVLRALTHAVDQDPTVIVSGGTTTTRTWALTQHAGQQPYAGETAPLVEAAHAVPDVRRARWSRDSQRRAPIAEPASLRNVIHAVLEAAAAPVAPRLMLDTILARFPLSAPGAPVDLDDTLIAAAAPSPESKLLALELFQQLSDNERLVVGLLGLPVREVADLSGLSRSTAQRAMTSAKAAAAEFLGDADDALGVLAAVAEASGSLRERGTVLAGSASAGHEED